ncbi:unnamed protein product, partial [Staurois parvus]
MPHISAYQCTSMPHISAHLSCLFKCHAISASQLPTLSNANHCHLSVLPNHCHLSVSISAAYQCPFTTASLLHISEGEKSLFKKLY